MIRSNTESKKGTGGIRATPLLLCLLLVVPVTAVQAAKEMFQKALEI